MPRRRQLAVPRGMMLGSGSAPPDAQESLLVASTATQARNPTTGTSGASGAHERQVDAIYAVVLAGMSERRFQAVIVSALRFRGWTVWTVPNMRLTTAGLPDILAVHEGWPMLLAWEIKTVVGRATVKQRAALAALGAVPGIDARIVRPSTWPALRDALDRGVLGVEA